jgi:hypothetical protein
MREREARHFRRCFQRSFHCFRCWENSSHCGEGSKKKEDESAAAFIMSWWSL